MMILSFLSVAAVLNTNQSQKKTAGISGGL